jgi:hypothetical protein
MERDLTEWFTCPEDGEPFRCEVLPLACSEHGTAFVGLVFWRSGEAEPYFVLSLSSPRATMLARALGMVAQQTAMVTVAGAAPQVD